MTTFRDHYTDLLPGLGKGSFLGVPSRRRHRSDIADGIDAIIAMWFDEYTDETDVPEEILDFIAFLADNLGGDVTSDRFDAAYDAVIDAEVTR
jgi:hypothetical protein